jgi:hypothetical protein
MTNEEKREHVIINTNSVPGIKVSIRHTVGHLFDARTASDWCFLEQKGS